MCYWCALSFSLPFPFPVQVKIKCKMDDHMKCRKLWQSWGKKPIKMKERNWFDFSYHSGSCSVCPHWIHRSGGDCWYRVPLFNDKTFWSVLCVSTPGYGPGQSPVKTLISIVIWLLQHRLCSKTAWDSGFFCCLLEDFMCFLTNLLHRTKSILQR